jgi:hypothetical protein
MKVIDFEEGFRSRRLFMPLGSSIRGFKGQGFMNYNWRISIERFARSRIEIMEVKLVTDESLVVENAGLLVDEEVRAKPAANLESEMSVRECIGYECTMTGSRDSPSHDSESMQALESDMHKYGLEDDGSDLTRLPPELLSPPARSLIRSVRPERGV